jgi:hypothetical protein
VWLSLPAAWLRGHALSSELLEEERTRLRAHGVTLTIVGV